MTQPQTEANMVADLFERARSLGYCVEGAARVSDSFVNYSLSDSGDECEIHRALRRVEGECEACAVISKSNDEGYTLDGWRATQARRAAEAEAIHAEETAHYATDRTSPFAVELSRPLDLG